MPLVLCTREEAENYLMHYRTKGSKNGVRKYQNEDGSYTALGRIHYGIGKAREKAHLVIAKSNSNKAAKLEGKAAKLANKAEIARIKYELHPDSAAAKAKYSDAANKSNRANVNLGLAKNRAQLHEQAAKNIANRDDMSKEDKLNAKAEQLQLKSEGSALLEKKYGGGEFAARAKKQALKSELARAKATKAGLTEEAKAAKEAEKAAAEEEKSRELKTNKRLMSDMDVYDKLTRDKKKEVGDEILAQYRKLSKADFDGYEVDGFADKTIDWLSEQVDVHSGNLNSGYFKTGSRGEKAFKEYQSECDKLWDREDQIKKEHKMTDKQIFGSRSTYNKFKKLCKADKVWSEIAENSDKKNEALLGAVLRDIGLSDTPENRSTIAWFVYRD